MQKTLSSILVLFMTLSFISCGGADTHDSVMNESLTLMDKIGAEMKKVTDKASAEKSKPTLEALVADMNTLKKRVDALGKPNAEQEAELKKKYDEKMKKALESFMGGMMKANMDPEISQVLKPVFDKIQK